MMMDTLLNIFEMFMQIMYNFYVQDAPSDIESDVDLPRPILREKPKPQKYETEIDRISKIAADMTNFPTNTPKFTRQKLFTEN